jgi:hypothetical protein
MLSRPRAKRTDTFVGSSGRAAAEPHPDFSSIGAKVLFPQVAASASRAQMSRIQDGASRSRCLAQSTERSSLAALGLTRRGGYVWYGAAM